MKPPFIIPPPDLAVEELLANDTPSRDAVVMNMLCRTWDPHFPTRTVAMFDGTAYALSFEEYIAYLFQLADRFRAEIAKSKQRERL